MNGWNERRDGRRASHTRSHGRLGVEHRIDPARGETRARAEARRLSRRRRPKGTFYTMYKRAHARARSSRSIARSNRIESRSSPTTRLDRSSDDVLDARWHRPRRPRRSSRVEDVIGRRRVRSFIHRHPTRYGRIDAKGPRGCGRMMNRNDIDIETRRRGEERRVREEKTRER